MFEERDHSERYQREENRRAAISERDCHLAALKLFLSRSKSLVATCKDDLSRLADVCVNPATMERCKDFGQSLEDSYTDLVSDVSAEIARLEESV
jgi:hypothetical protein